MQGWEVRYVTAAVVRIWLVGTANQNESLHVDRTTIKKSAGAQPLNIQHMDNPSTPKLAHQFIQFTDPGTKYASVNQFRDGSLVCRARVGGALAAAVVVIGGWVLQKNK